MRPSPFAAEAKLEPYWWEAAPRPSLAPAALPARADVAVIGSGFSGLSAALTLVRAGRSVVVLEAGAPGHGASSRNGGMCGGAFKVPFSALARRCGLARATAIYREGRAALDYLAELIEREQIHCHFARMGRFVGAWTPGHYETMAREGELLRKHVGLEAEMIPRREQHAEIDTDVYHGGRLIPGDGGLHPGLYHQGLLERATASGVDVAAETPATTIARDDGGFTVASPRGRLVARNVIVATNGYTGEATPRLRRRLVPVGSFMIATEPLAPALMARLIPRGRMLADSKRILYYFRPSPDGRRLLFGGRAAYGRSEDLRATGARLHRFMSRVFPELAGARITHSWGGNVAFTFDRLPHGGVRDGVHYALGYCGSGVVKATWLGHKAALNVLGAPEADSALWGGDFPTVPGYNGTPWFLAFVSAWYNVQDRLGR